MLELTAGLSEVPGVVPAAELTSILNQPGNPGRTPLSGILSSGWVFTKGAK